MQAVRQVVFTYMLIVGQLDVDGHSFAPIGLHKIYAASDWFLIKWLCISLKGLPEVQVQKQSDNSSYRHDFSIYRRVSDSYPAFFLLIATTSNKNF